MTFVRYLSDKNFDAIIIEDADELLTAERGDYNKIISKILNVSDGLIKLPKKKLILTTNLEKLNDLDPAIIRPGRCFDVMEFRPFNQQEFTQVADEMGLSLTEEEKNQKRMTLAELYSLREQRQNGDPLLTSHKIKVNKVGFV
jgi:ATP-dependent 26S proteasome regulatory subunit